MSVVPYRDPHREGRILTDWLFGPWVKAASVRAVLGAHMMARPAHDSARVGVTIAVATLKADGWTLDYDGKARPLTLLTDSLQLAGPARA